MEKTETLSNPAIESSNDVSELKRRILEKLKASRAASSQKTPDLKPQTPLESPPPAAAASAQESKKLKELYEKALKQNDKLLAQIEEKNSLVVELQKTVAKRSDDSAKMDRLRQEYESRISGLEDANKRLKESYEKVLKENNNLLNRAGELEKKASDLEKKAAQSDSFDAKLAEKDEEIARLEKKISEEMADLKADRDKAAANINTLRSRIFTQTNEAKEHQARAAQLEERLRSREKKIAENENAFKAFEGEKAGMAAKVDLLAGEKVKLEEEIKRLSGEAEEAKTKLTDAEKQHAKNFEIAKNESAVKVQAAFREKRDLEGKIAQLDLELQAKNNRIKEAEERHREREEIIKESTSKMQSLDMDKKELEEKIASLNGQMETLSRKAQSDRAVLETEAARFRQEIDGLKAAVSEKEKAEADLKELVSQLRIDIENRDKKIETDLKYCEKLVREIGELRQRARASFVKTVK